MSDATIHTSETIQSFRIEIPEAELDDLRDRLARTRWPRRAAGRRAGAAACRWAT